MGSHDSHDYIYAGLFYQKNDKYIKRGWGIGNGKNRGNRGGVNFTNILNYEGN